MTARDDRAATAAIKQYYSQLAEAEWERLARNRMELALTLRALADYLPPPPATILDCGGGPGRYAIELARLGHSVTLFDLSAECLQVARRKIAEANVTLAGIEQGTATDLTRFAPESFDVVVLLGPLYHLTEEGDRRQALQQVRRVLKPGGLLFAAFIPRYAIIRYKAVHEPTWVLEESERLEQLLTTGVVGPRDADKLEFVAHYAHPTEIGPLCESEGFEMIRLIGVEGLVSMIEERVNVLTGEAWDAWVDVNYRVAADPSIQGCVGHLLAIARR